MSRREDHARVVLWTRTEALVLAVAGVLRTLEIAERVVEVPGTVELTCLQREAVVREREGVGQGLALALALKGRGLEGVATEEARLGGEGAEDLRGGAAAAHDAADLHRARDRGCDRAGAFLTRLSGLLGGWCVLFDCCLLVLENSSLTRRIWSYLYATPIVGVSARED